MLPGPGAVAYAPGSSSCSAGWLSWYRSPCWRSLLPLYCAGSSGIHIGAAGLVVFLLGLFLLVAAGGPPVGAHGIETFVRSGFEARSGALGEALYAGLHRAVGTVGVAILGWLAGLVGLILTTGITGVWVAGRTRRVADAVKRSAERSATALEDTEREWGTGGGAANVRSSWPTIEGQQGAGRSGGRDPVRLGPIDLVGKAAEAAEAASTAGRKPEDNLGDAFEEWAIPRMRG